MFGMLLHSKAKIPSALNWQGLPDRAKQAGPANSTSMFKKEVNVGIDIYLLPVKSHCWGKHLCVGEQGTAATAVAGVYGALAVQGKEFKELTKQRIVLVGAGSAGMGVARMLALGMVKQVLHKSDQLHI